MTLTITYNKDLVMRKMCLLSVYKYEKQRIVVHTSVNRLMILLLVRSQMKAPCLDVAAAIQLRSAGAQDKE